MRSCSFKTFVSVIKIHCGINDQFFPCKQIWIRRIGKLHVILEGEEAKGPERGGKAQRGA